MSLLATTGRCMDTLRHLETCYDLLMPAQEKSIEAFAWFSGLPHPLFNAIMHLEGKDSIEKLDRLIHTGQLFGPLSIWVPKGQDNVPLAQAAQERGFVSIGICPLMKWSVTPISQKPQHEIQKDALAFNELVSKNFELQGELKEKFLKLLQARSAENYVVYQQGKPVGTGTFLHNGEIGGIFNMSTLPEERNKGCATSLMHFIMQRAFKLNLKQLVLLSTPEAEKLYEKIGFETVLRIEPFAK